MLLHKEPYFFGSIRNGSRFRSHICCQADFAEASWKAAFLSLSLSLSLSLWLVQQAGEAWTAGSAQPMGCIRR